MNPLIEKALERFKDRTSFRFLEMSLKDELLSFLISELETMRSATLKEVEEDYIRHLVEYTCDKKHLIDWVKAKERAEVKDMQRWT